VVWCFGCCARVRRGFRVSRPVLEFAPFRFSFGFSPRTPRISLGGYPFLRNSAWGKMKFRGCGGRANRKPIIKRDRCQHISPGRNKADRLEGGWIRSDLNGANPTRRGFGFGLGVVPARISFEIRKVPGGTPQVSFFSILAMKLLAKFKLDRHPSGRHAFPLEI
jgi:hypothetical protein